MEIYNNIKIIKGKFNSKFPYCRTILIDDKNEKAIIDPGAGREILINLLKNYKPKYVYNTHYHYDHIHYNYLFYRSKIFLNKIEAECFINRINILKRVGIFEVYGQKSIDDWIFYTKQVNTKKTPYSPSRNHAWYLSTCRLNGTYEYNERIKCGSIEFEFIHTPGHSAGFCCVLFPNEELIYTGDIDLTSFGPWYAGTDADIDDFIQSSWKIAKLDVKYYVTGHEMGTFTHDGFIKELELYLRKIDLRDEKILNIINQNDSMSVDEITDLGLIYGGPRYLIDPWVYAWEKVSIKKHLKRLEKMNKIIKIDNKYVIK
ncbi:MAG: MBL fold metallo-hydrolase [Candidatus Helarchaeota archaeon]